jgi:hypothetical protein
MGHMDVDVAALLLPYLVSWPETGRRVSPPRGRCMSNADVLINGRMGSSTRSIELGFSMLYSCQKSIECMQVVYVKVDENKPIVGAPSSFHAATRGIASRFFHIHRKTMPLYSFGTSRTHARPKSHVWSKMAKNQQKT